jgi:hypothetical protein
MHALEKELGFKPPDDAVLGRRAKSEEVAKLIQFLLSSDSSYTTGSVYQIDGGSVCWFTRQGYNATQQDHDVLKLSRMPTDRRLMRLPGGWWAKGNIGILEILPGWLLANGWSVQGWAVRESRDWIRNL